MKGKKLIIAAAAALLGVTSMAGCGKKKDPTPVVVDVKIELNKATLELNAGSTETLVATVTPEGTQVAWSSSDEAVATVANGVVTAVAKGECDIIAKAGDKEAKCHLTVTEKPAVTALSVSIKDINSEILTRYWDEDAEDYGPDYAPLNITFKTVGEADHLKELTVTSSDESKLTIVEYDGDYYAFSSGVEGNTGKVKVTVQSVFDATKKAEVEINIVDPYVRSAELNTAGIYLVVGDANFGKQTLKGSFEAFGDDKFEPAEAFASSDEAVATVDEETGEVTAVAEGTAVITYTVGGKVATCNVVVMEAGSKLPANGAKSYVYSSAKDRAEILGKLEQYAVANKLTGLTLYGNGGYAIYSDSVKKPTEKYVPGFGFGILSEGDIIADLAGENKAEWKRYMHSYLTEDPHSLNYMDDKGSVVGDLIGYVTSSYFATYLNSSKDGYKWVKGLALNEDDRPIAVNPDVHTGLATKFRIQVRVGAQLKYSTNSANNDIKAFNNREATLQDYITPYQIYFTQSYGLARSAENLEGTGSIKGAKAYYDASKAGFNAEAWDKIGIKGVVDNGKSYLEFELNNACTPFYAMYYLSSGMFAPVPETFIKDTLGGGDLEKGVKIWGKSNEEGTLTPKDTFLSTGPYVVEQWDADQQIVFKRNENWDDGVHYNIQGVHLNILTAMKTDPEAALKEFNANKLSSCGIPSTKLNDYVGEDGTILDTRVRQTVGDSNFKLNLNTCSQETWEKLFGVNGTITKTPASQYWELKPAMQNKDFVSGLSFAIDRKTYAAALGRTPAATYFSDAYMSDPENGISYNSTPEHAAAVKDLIGEAAGTDEYGYSFEKAKQSFKKAADALLAQGAYKAGDTIKIEVAWMEASDEDMFHKPLEAMIEKAFNECGSSLKLDLVFWVGQEWSDVYYNKMMLGQFDIGFGSISGNTYDPLNFLEVLRSDNSSGFTLNWGLDTNGVDGQLEYDGLVWSFDGLWTAADQGAYVVNGANSPLDFSYDEKTLSIQADDTNKKLVVTIDVKEENIDEGTIKTTFAGAKIYGYVTLSTAGYREFSFKDPVKAADQTGVKDGYVRYTMEIDYDAYKEIANANSDLYASYGYAGIDLYFVTEMFGVASDPAYKNGVPLTSIPGVPAN